MRLRLVAELFGGAEMVLGTGVVSSGQESRGELMVEHAEPWLGAGGG